MIRWISLGVLLAIIAISLIVIDPMAPTAENACDNIHFEFASVSSSTTTCFDATNGRLNVVVRNHGADIDTFALDISDGSQEVVTQSHDANLDDGALGQYHFPYATQSPNTLTATLTARIYVDSDEGRIQIPCRDTSIELVRVPMCTQ